MVKISPAVLSDVSGLIQCLVYSNLCMIVLKTQCHACGDVGTLWECVGCHIKLCIDKELQTSCVIFNEDSIMEEEDFRCPRCIMATGETVPVSHIL